MGEMAYGRLEAGTLTTPSPSRAGLGLGLGHMDDWRLGLSQLLVRVGLG